MKTPQHQQPKDVVLEPGLCPFCKKRVIEELGVNKFKYSTDYREFWVLLSDNSRMKVGICENCRETLTTAKVDELMRVHATYWIEGLKQSYATQIKKLEADRDKHITYYGQMSFIRYGMSESDLT